MNIRKQTYIYIGSNYFKVVMSLAVNAVLSRILSANDYGVIAVITVFSVLFTTLSDVGVGPAIVQIKDLTKKELDDIFSFTCYIALVLTILFSIVSFPVSIFYENDIYIPLGNILSISVFFNILNMVPNGILNKNKSFIYIAIRNITIYSFTSVITIILAIKGWGAYALVLQSVLASFLTFVVSFGKARPVFKKAFDINSIKKIASFSGFQFAFNIICYISRNLDNLLTGKYLSSDDLGYYSKAYTLMLYPVNNLGGVFSPVLHPLMSDFQNKPMLIYQKYSKLARTLILVGILASSVCFLGSKEIVSIICGNNWDRTAVCFKCMSVAIIPQMLNSCVGAIYQSLGNTRLLFVNSCINIIASTIAIIVGVFFFKDIYFLSICIAVVYFFHFIAAHYMLFEFGLKCRFTIFLRDIKKEMIVLCGVVLACVLWNDMETGILLSLFIKLTYAFLSFVLMLLITGEYRFLIDELRRNKIHESNSERH